MHLPNEDFKNLIKNGILLSIDLIIKNERSEVLVGKRINPPARGYWFVPGGRIFKNENFQDALHRICTAEVGFLKEGYSYASIGMYNHIYEDNFFENPEFNTHYIALGIELKESDIDIKNSMKDQHAEFEYFSIDEILKNKKVHDNTRYYFMENPPNKFI